MNDLLHIVLLTQLIATAFMTGLIWYVQVVHYPLMLRVGAGSFVEYHHHHTRHTSWIVIPGMLIELASAVTLTILCYQSQDRGDFLVAAIGLSLLLGIWLSTAIVQVPCHRQLEKKFDEQTTLQLIRGNWLRTFLWSARCALTVWMLVLMT